MCECYKVLYESGNNDFFEHISEDHFEGLGFKITLINNKIIASTIDYVGNDIGLNSIKINYCPICGEKIT